jgi:hypothetical protein
VASARTPREKRFRTALQGGEDHLIACSLPSASARYGRIDRCALPLERSLGCPLPDVRVQPERSLPAIPCLEELYVSQSLGATRQFLCQGAGLYAWV